ncbi:MAG TPA: FAD-dependent oxidoreductase [Caulobacteraceae bacterium]|nr:FAD-dependent oxidoreductase [Caulobacteraceae bacterium]
MGLKASIAVAGAGVIGSTIALTLARAGYRVRAFDPAPVGENASGVAAGMLAPAFETLFDPGAAGGFELLREARDAWPTFASSIGLPIDRAGAVVLGRASDVATWADRMAGFGAVAERLGPTTVAAKVPGAQPGAEGLFSSDDWRIDAAAGTQALHRACSAAGVGREARALSEPPRDADLLVVATGASRSLLGIVPEIRALTPIKGHILRAPFVGGGGPVLRGEGVYLCVGANEVVLGASMEVGRDDRRIDPVVVADLIQRVERLRPGAGRLAWRAQTGVRAATPDGLPLVGWAERPGVMLAVGARRNGWLLAPLAAEAVLAVVEGRRRTWAAELFDPARLVSQPG